MMLTPKLILVMFKIKMKKSILLLAGRTGGPLSPLLAISSQLSFRPFIVGVLNGYEKTVANQKGYTFLPLPQTKLSALSFSSTKWKIIYELPVQLVILIFSIILCISYIIKYQPVAVLGAGGFTSVPMVFAIKIMQFFGDNTQIIIHQQDPEIGLSNKIAFRFAHIKSYIFNYSKYSKLLKNAIQIPNPIQFELYQESVQNEIAKKFPDISNFLRNKTKPIFMIFGGGSGAKVINDWVIKNQKLLLNNFNIVHITGLLQKSELPYISNKNYLRIEFAIEEMPMLMKQSDLILCRAGLGSISELKYLNKPAFLVPIKNSHQELNAEVVKNDFIILDQISVDSWLETILTKYPLSFKNMNQSDNSKYRNDLINYYHYLDSKLNI
jgi:UDP-N-acetylglucosamine--N-acetylmuramyl-(pentapeptide) pyrophosphoryl-undecaprenol N-acetylglucosamine transferase